MKITSKIEYLGSVKHIHDSPLNIEPTETHQLTIPAWKYYNDNSAGSLTINHHIYSILLDEDVYDVDGLIHQLQQKLSFIQFEHKNNTVTLIHTESKYKFYELKLTDQIKAILGVSEISTCYSSLNTLREEKGVFRPFFGYGQQKMYIYVDIIENQFIGSQLAPLLRITDYKGQNATTTIQEFAHHHYVPLRNVNLDQIHMYIRSETSDFLPIELGTLSATLHFRRKRF